MTDDKSLDRLLARGFNRLRAARAWSQDELARRMREQTGHQWTRETVAGIERGARKVLPSEWFAASVVFETEIEAFVPEVGPIAIGPTFLIEAKAFRRLIKTQQLLKARAQELSMPEKEVARELAFEAVSVMRASLSLFKGKAGPVGGDFSKWKAASSSEAEQTAAKKLRVSPVLVAAAAFALWGHSLTDEREARLGDGALDRPTRARRGHITRALIAEVAKHMDASLSSNQRASVTIRPPSSKAKTPRA